MLGRQERWQEDLLVAAPLRDLVPDDHILKRVDRVLDLSWLRDQVRDCYDEQQGRPSIDPEAAVRLMRAALFHGITEERKLMREGLQRGGRPADHGEPTPLPGEGLPALRRRAEDAGDRQPHHLVELGANDQRGLAAQGNS